MLKHWRLGDHRIKMRLKYKLSLSRLFILLSRRRRCYRRRQAALIHKIMLRCLLFYCSLLPLYKSYCTSQDNAALFTCLLFTVNCRYVQASVRHKIMLRCLPAYYLWLMWTLPPLESSLSVLRHWKVISAQFELNSTDFGSAVEKKLRTSRNDQTLRVKTLSPL
jgi:hypothetical protein